MNQKPMTMVAIATAALVVVAAGAAESRADVETSQGQVVSVDTDAPSITVVFEGRTDKATLEVVESTKVMKDGRPSTLEEVSPGDRVAVNYQKNDGGYLALAIAVLETQGQKKAPPGYSAAPGGAGCAERGYADFNSTLVATRGPLPDSRNVISACSPA